MAAIIQFHMKLLNFLNILKKHKIKKFAFLKHDSLQKVCVDFVVNILINGVIIAFCIIDRVFFIFLLSC